MVTPFLESLRAERRRKSRCGVRAGGGMHGGV